MYHVDVSPDVSQSTHHVSLTDGKKTLGLIICDSKGAADPFNLSAAPNQRSSLRTKSGTTKYEDLEEPWSATAQDDWSGGRALEDYEEDTTRFYDSKRAQTAWKQIYCAPLEHYATGLKDAMTNYPGSVHWQTVYGGTSYVYQLEPTSTLSIGMIYILMRRRGKPAAGLTVALLAGINDSLDNALAKRTFTTSDITDVISEFKRMVFSTAQTLTSGNTYYLLVTSTKGDSNDHWEIGMKPDSGAFHTYTKTGSGAWSLLAGKDLYYRICAPNNSRNTRFFTYKQLTFALTQTMAGYPKLYINGDIGEADSNSGDLTKVNDATKSWTVDQWKGCRVGIIQGKGVEESKSVWRTITGNTATSLTVDEAWTIAQDTSTVYIITDTEQFTEIPSGTHGLTGFVSDIIIANDIIYFAQGDAIPIRKMKWAAGSWTSMADQYAHIVNGSTVTIKNCAMYLQTVRDTTGLVLWRAQNDDDNHQISISQSAVTDWLSTPITVVDRSTAIDSNASDFFTTGVDFGKADDVAIMYKVTAGTITGTDLPKFRITLQGSEDNVIYEDIKYVDLDTSAERLYFSASSHKRWRRLHVKIIAGTNSAMSSLKVVTVNNSKFIGTHIFKDSYGKITGLAEYQQMMNTAYKTLWINREGMIHTVSSTATVDTINLEELSTVMEEWNGKTSMLHNVYYYVRWMKGGIQRYYNMQLDSVGPDRDTGLPEDRQGQIADMLPYPGRYFVAVDAGATGYSSVLLNNNAGWHEIYRAPNKGERIRALGYQAISGPRPDRLWISVGDDVVWLVMPSNTLKAYYDDEAEYTHESVVVSSWMSIGMVDVIKQWGSMNIMAENLTKDGIHVEADYQIDQDPTWYPMAAHYTESPDQEIKFNDVFGVSAKRLRYRLRLQTNDMHKTPFIKAVVMKTVIRVNTKYCYSMSCRNVINDVNLRGEPEDMSPWDRLSLLTYWANNATALKMNAFTDPFDGKIVFVDPPAYSNLREMDRPGNLIQLTLNEI